MDDLARLPSGLLLRLRSSGLRRMRAWRSRSTRFGLRLIRLSQLNAVSRAVRVIELNAMPMRGGLIERNSVSVCHFRLIRSGLFSFACRRRAAQPKIILSGPLT
jgi:hypothetical protein